MFSTTDEARNGLDAHEITMNTKILLRMPKDFVLPKDWEPGEVKVVDPEPGSPDVVKEERLADRGYLFATNFGRVLVNGCLPGGLPVYQRAHLQGPPVRHRR